MISKLHKLGLTTALVLGSVMLATTAFAQAPAQQQAPSQQAPSQSKAAASPIDTGPAPTNTELKNFAHAAMGVMKVEKTVGPKIRATKDAADRTKLVTAANKKIEDTIRSSHLTVHRYEQIAMVVQKDKKVRAEVLKMIKAPAKS